MGFAGLVQGGDVLPGAQDMQTGGGLGELVLRADDDRVLRAELQAADRNDTERVGVWVGFGQGFERLLQTPEFTGGVVRVPELLLAFAADQQGLAFEARTIQAQSKGVDGDCAQEATATVTAKSASGSLYVCCGVKPDGASSAAMEAELNL